MLYTRVRESIISVILPRREDSKIKRQTPQQEDALLFHRSIPHGCIAVPLMSGCLTSLEVRLAWGYAASLEASSIDCLGLGD